MTRSWLALCSKIALRKQGLREATRQDSGHRSHRIQPSILDQAGGRLLAAAHLPFRRVIGVEFAGNLHRDACDNIAHYPQERLKCREVVSLNVNAVEFDMPDENFVAFFFNLFTGDILDRVAQRIERAC